MTTLLERAVPFDGQAISPREWRAMADAEMLDGPLRGEAGEFAVTVPVVGLNVRVGAGEAIIAGVHVQNAASKTLTCEPAATDYGRRDLVVAGVDYAAKKGYVSILTGTPSASPEAPVAVDDSERREIPLAEVAVAASDTVLAASDLTDVRMVAVPRNGAGGLIGRLSVDADSVTASTAAEVLQPNWSLDVALRLGRVYDIRLVANILNGTVRVRDGGLTGALLLNTNSDTDAEIFTLAGLFDALDEGAHTLVVTSDTVGASAHTITGATNAATANYNHQRPWLLVNDLGPLRT